MLQKYSNQYDGIQISPVINQNVTMTIYSSTGSNQYSLEEIVSGKGDIKIDVKGYSNLYVVAKSDGSKIGKFMFKASLYKNPLSPGVIVGIVLGSVAFCVIVILIFVWWIKSCKRRSQARRAALLNRQAPQVNRMQENKPRAQPSQYPQPAQYGQPGSQPSQYNQPSYQQYPVNQPSTQPYAYTKTGYKENEPLLQNAAFQVSNTQQPAYPFMPQSNKYLPANPAYPTPGGKE